MKAITVRRPGGLDRLEVTEVADAAPPGPGEIRVRLHATSLNYHDYSVAKGYIPAEDGRIPMADGAGTVDAVGDGVTEFRKGDVSSLGDTSTLADPAVVDDLVANRVG